MFQMHPFIMEPKNGLGLATARQFNTFSNNRRGKRGKGGKGGKGRRSDHFDSRKAARFEDRTNERYDERRSDREDKPQFLPFTERMCTWEDCTQNYEHRRRDCQLFLAKPCT